MRRYIRFLFGSILVLLISSCAATRAIRYGNPTIESRNVFDCDTILNGDETFHFAELPNDKRILDHTPLDIYSTKSDTFRRMTLNEAIDYVGKPAATIIIKNDTIIYEHYSKGLDRYWQSNIFSITKTITAMLCGIALKDGDIHSVDDAVVKYIPELKDANPMFSQLKIGHLLDMCAGLKFEESYAYNPFSLMSKLYYSENTLDVIKKIKFSHTPGELYHYDSMTTAILGVVVERATGVRYADYLSERVWKPLGMDQPATITLDSRKSGIAKSYGGLTTNVRDLAKIGRLFLNKGCWNGVQIVDSAFVNRSHSKNFVGNNHGTYSYSWYWGTTDYKRFDTQDSVDAYYANIPDTEVCAKRLSRDSGKYTAILHNGGYWAYGLYGQVLYVNTPKNIIAVFLGADRIEDFYNVFDRVCKLL